MTEKTPDLMEKIVSLCKRRGFIFSGSEIYGGFAGTYDLGHYGVLLRKNIVNAWMNAMGEHDNVAFLDASIVSSGKVWEASGHIHNFSDPLVVCLSCGTKHRADHLLESIGVVADEKMSLEELNALFNANRDKLSCSNCGKKDFDKVTNTYLLATTNLGMFSKDDDQVYLRGETAQGTYINYKNVHDSIFHHLPFGAAQVGKVFRNEISPRQFLFRTRELEQMEMQYFVSPNDAEASYEMWKQERMAYYDKLGIKKENLHFKQHENLVFYAKAAWDIEYNFPFGWGELEGLHYRGDYDLTQHQNVSGIDMTYFDEEAKERYIPHVVETAVGVGRTMLMVLLEAYTEDEMGGEKRIVLKFKPKIAPVTVAVFPLLKNKPELVEKAREVYKILKKEFGNVVFDDNGNIGKRYRRQDEIGTPWCVTVDFETIEQNTGVTVRDRDTGEQKRMQVENLVNYVKSAIQ